MHLKISKPFEVNNYNLEIGTVECPYCKKSAIYRWIDNLPNTNKCRHCKKEFFFGYTFMEMDEDAYHYMKCIDCGMVHCKGDILRNNACDCGCADFTQVYVDNSEGNINGEFVKKGDVYVEYEYEEHEAVELSDDIDTMESNYSDMLCDNWIQNLKDNQIEMYDMLHKLVVSIQDILPIAPTMNGVYDDAIELIDKIDKVD